MKVKNMLYAGLGMGNVVEKKLYEHYQKMIEEGYAVPYTGGNKEELEALHMKNKQKLIEKGLLEE